MFRNGVFDARNAFAPVRLPENRQLYEGSVSGPLWHDKKNSFLLSVDEDVDNQQSAVLADTPTGTVNQSVPSPRVTSSVRGASFTTSSTATKHGSDIPTSTRS